MAHIDTFLEQLDTFPLLENVGKPSRRDDQVFRIYSWDEWPGPENDGSELQAENYMEWRDAVVKGETGSPDEARLALFWAIHERVIELVRNKIPYEEDEDAWYAPNAAAWSVGWIAGVVGCTIAKHGRFPTDNQAPESQWSLAKEWLWYREGHWPCSYYEPEPPGGRLAKTRDYWPNDDYWYADDPVADEAARNGDPRKLIVF